MNLVTHPDGTPWIEVTDVKYLAGPNKGQTIADADVKATLTDLATGTPVTGVNNLTVPATVAGEYAVMVPAGAIQAGKKYELTTVLQVGAFRRTVTKKITVVRDEGED